MSKVVALEIAPHAIKAVEIAGYRGKKPKILKVGEIKLAEGIAGESQVFDDDRLSAALDDLWRQEKFSTRSIGLVVSGRRFIVRPHTTSRTSLTVLRKILPFEAPGAFPEQVDELIYDFYPTHVVDQKGGAMATEGLVISSPAESIGELAFAMKKAKLDLEYVDFIPIAVTRWILRNRPEKNYALVNIRDESTDVAIVENGMPRVIRVLSKGLDTNRRRFDRPAGGAASPLLRRDILGESGVKMLVQDVNLTVRTQSESVAGDLECIFTSGSRADDPELLHSIGELLNLPVLPLSIESTTLQENQAENLKPSFDEFVAMTGGMR